MQRQRRDAEVAHELELAVGVAAGDRQDGGAETLAAVVQAETAGEQAVAVGVLQHVAGLHAAGGQRAGDEVGPQVDVAGRVAHGGRIAGRARRGVHAHHALARHGEHAERVVVAQVDLGGERQRAQIVVAGHVAGRHAGLGEPAAVERHVVGGVAQGGPQALHLGIAQKLDRHGLGSLLPVVAAGLVGGDRAGSDRAGSHGAHRVFTWSSESSVTLPASSSTARSTSCTAKQTLLNEML